MKKILTTLLATTLLISCSKEDVQTNNNESIATSKFNGSWELASRSAFVATMYPVGNGNIIKLKGDGTLERYQQNALVYSGNYTLTEAKAPCAPNNSILLFNSSDSLAGSGEISIQDGNLKILSSSCTADAETAVFRKTGN